MRAILNAAWLLVGWFAFIQVAAQNDVVLQSSEEGRELGPGNTGAIESSEDEYEDGKTSFMSLRASVPNLDGSRFPSEREYMTFEQAKESLAALSSENRVRYCIGTECSWKKKEPDEDKSIRSVIRRDQKDEEAFEKERNAMVHDDVLQPPARFEPRTVIFDPKGKDKNDEAPSTKDNKSPIHGGLNNDDTSLFTSVVSKPDFVKLDDFSSDEELLYHVLGTVVSKANDMIAVSYLRSEAAYEPSKNLQSGRRVLRRSDKPAEESMDEELGNKETQTGVAAAGLDPIAWARLKNVISKLPTDPDIDEAGLTIPVAGQGPNVDKQALDKAAVEVVQHTDCEKSHDLAREQFEAVLQAHREEQQEEEEEGQLQKGDSN